MIHAIPSFALAAACVLQVPQTQPAVSDATADALHFESLRIDDDYISEGADVADLNNDGELDVTSGVRWYEGPDFERARTILPVGPFSITSYSDVFHVFTDDVDEDGWTDVLAQSYPSWPCIWVENPGGTGAWKAHVLHPNVDGEHPAFEDVDGDGRRDLVFANQGRLGYATRVPNQPLAPWTFHAVTPNIGYTVFSHGLGFDDVTGDGRQDLLFASGFYEQPASLQGDPLWTLHPHNFGGPPGGSNMFAFDADQDGDRDVIAAANAHGYGLSWFEQVSSPMPGEFAFQVHPILTIGGAPRTGVQVSQLHGAAFGDVNGDGVGDYVSGKSYYAHNGLDPGAEDPALLVVFLTKRRSGEAWFEPKIVHEDSGTGRRLVVVDLDRNGRGDIVHAGKKGVWVHLSR